MRTLDDDTVTSIVGLACRAPSVHNTQPWSLTWFGDRLEVRTDTRRQLMYADGAGRDLVLSCGALLHHLVIAAAAAGWSATVRRMPAPNDPTLLASLRFTEKNPTPADQRLASFIEHRRTDRRPVSSWPVPEARLKEITALAHQYGVLATGNLSGEARQLVFVAGEAARKTQTRNDSYLDELMAYSNTRGGVGVPRTNLPTRRSADSGAASSLSRFPAGWLESDVDFDTDTDMEAAWLILATSSDDPLSWLRAGEALSAIWLTCTGAGWSLVPYTQPIEVATTRQLVQRQVLEDNACPQVLLRIGWPALDRTPVTRTERLATEAVLHFRGVAAHHTTL